jgi:hypothetical protein
MRIAVRQRSIGDGQGRLTMIAGVLYFGGVSRGKDQAEGDRGGRPAELHRRVHIPAVWSRLVIGPLGSEARDG